MNHEGPIQLKSNSTILTSNYLVGSYLRKLKRASPAQSSCGLKKPLNTKQYQWILKKFGHKITNYEGPIQIKSNSTIFTSNFLVDSYLRKLKKASPMKSSCGSENH